MINILFVDDEPNILSGQQRMLRSMRHEWNMTFANGGAEALNTLSKNKIDVVVSDMKMPGMDGTQLLKTVQDTYPHIVRILLSGYSEMALTLKSVGIAHQYLSKPCDSEMLKEIVSRAYALRNLVPDENLQRIVSKMHTVQSLPSVYNELRQELSLEKPRMQKIGELIKTDIGMTVKVLQIVNSAFFGLRRTVSDANEAIRFLGLDTISSLTLGIGVFSHFETKIKPEFFANLWQHSIAVGGTAKKIAQNSFPLTANDSFTAGLIHDIGKLILNINLPEQYALAEETAKHENITNWDAEKQIFGSNHAEVGAYLLSLWGLPESVVEAVAFHHQPNIIQTTSFTPLTAVYISNIFHRSPTEVILKQPETVFDFKYLEELNIVQKIPFWYEKFMQTDD